MWRKIICVYLLLAAVFVCRTNNLVMREKIHMSKAVFSKKTPFTSNFHFNFRKKVAKWYI